MFQSYREGPGCQEKQPYSVIDFLFQWPSGGLPQARFPQALGQGFIIIYDSLQASVEGL
jgi:hypothetical protein